MSKMSRVLTVAALSAIAMGAFAGNAFAANRFAKVKIRNATHGPIHYDIQWGDDNWQACTVWPNQVQHHSWRYPKPNANESPRLRIRFDADMSPITYWHRYELRKDACPDTSPEYGKPYVFVRDGSGGRYIDLKNDN